VIAMQQKWNLTFGDYTAALDAMRARSSQERLDILTTHDVEATLTVEAFDEQWSTAKDAPTSSDPSEGRSGRAR